MAEFTHDLKIEAGGYVLEGECEFNTDGVPSYKLDVYPEEGLSTEQVNQLHGVIDCAKRVEEIFGDLQLIRIKKKQA